MESRFQRLLLTSCLMLGASLGYTPCALAQEEEQDNGKIDEATVLDAVISPDLKRREIDEDQIDNEDIEFGFFSGVMSVEDFGSNNVYGVRAAYHITEDFFIEGNIGGTQTSKTSFEVLSGGSDLLTEEERELLYYNMSLGINLLPGEVYISKDYAFNTNYYVIFGMGNTQFAGNEYITYNFGGGFRLFATDWLALRVDFRNHLFTHNILGEDKSIQNLEAQAGLSLYF